MGNFLKPQVTLNNIYGKMGTMGIRKGRIFIRRDICKDMVLSKFFKWKKKNIRESRKNKFKKYSQGWLRHVEKGE